MKISNTSEFLIDDHGRTLFPLTMSKVLVEHGSKLIDEHILKCFSASEKSFNFLPQERVYGSKTNLHLRRTAKLDPVAEYYLYSVVYKNRSLFRKSHKIERSHFGYRFESGLPISSTIAYKAFRTAIARYKKSYKFFISFDVATYFNGVYHHDLAAWFSRLGVSSSEAEQFGIFFRQIGSGRSLDCLPHGLYASKMIGSDYLRFIDDSMLIKSEQLIRFMDDFYLFSDRKDILDQDFLTIQRMLGERGLSVNPKKTDKVHSGHMKIVDDIDIIKKNLLDRRRFIIDVAGYDEDPELIEFETRDPLSDEEHRYLSELLSRDQIEEDDAELILSTMKEHADEVGARIETIIAGFPHLAKSVAIFCSKFTNQEMVADIVMRYVKATAVIQEYQLFWFGYMIENYLIKTSKASNLIEAVYNHPSATHISKAKILEIADIRFGLQDLRDSLLRQSDWLSWSAAVGSRALPPAERNYKLSYFANASNMNHLIKEIMQKIP